MIEPIPLRGKEGYAVIKPSVGPKITNNVGNGWTDELKQIPGLRETIQDQLESRNELHIDPVGSQAGIITTPF